MPKETSSPTYSALFENDQDAFCSATSLAAVDSPAAYLRALYLFALQVEQTGKGTRTKATLAQRRPMLQALVIDAENTTRQVPLLTLVNEALTEPVKAYLGNNRDLYGNRPVEQILADLRYPFLLPFDLAHRQCVLGLAGNKPGLGALNYRISLKLPCSQHPENKYGTIQQEAYVAQRLLTLLSPAQQNLLSESIYGQNPTLDPAPAAFYKRHYGNSQPITERQQFMRHTGLNSQQFNELLAQGSYRPYLSDNVIQNPDQLAEDLRVGARYINGPFMAGQKHLGLGSDTTGKTHLQHTSIQRHDRLQRMIRLQRWLDMPFVDLDTLLYSAMRCETPATQHFTINDNSLRALGVFRYLSKSYGLRPEVFSAWLFQIPVHGVGQNPALFDQVFNPPRGFNSPLTLDNQPLDLDTTDTSLYQICAALGLEDTPDSLGLLKSRTRHYLSAPGRNIATLSSLYRQATVPGMFGLSVRDCDHLTQLLGGETYRQQLVKPDLRTSGSNAPADFLDVLMQLDWAVTWLKNIGISVPQLRQQLLLETATETLRVQQRLKEVDDVLQRLQGYLLPQALIDGLDLPRPEAQVKPLPYSWSVLLAKGLLRAQPQLPRQPKPDSLEKSIAHMVDRYITLSQDPERNQTLKADVKHKLNSQISAAYTLLLPFREQVQQLLKDNALASEAPDLLKHKGKQATRIFANALGSDGSRETLKHLLLFLPNAQIDLQLPISHLALQAFVHNPHWLDAEHTGSATLRLTLGTLYLFNRFNHFSELYAVDHNTVLNYLRLANELGQGPESATKINQQLSLMLGWSTSEVLALVDRLPNKRVLSMAQLDWLMRCHDTARLTGLSAHRLLMATGLTATFSSDDWKQVGSAILAAHP